MTYAITSPGRVMLLAILATFLCASAAKSGLLGVDWVRYAAAKSSIAFETLDASRRAALSSENVGSADLIHRVEYSREGNMLLERVRIVRLFLSTDGIESMGEFELGAVPSREDLLISTAYSVRADGHRRDVDAATMQVTDDARPRIFSDFKLLTIPCPAIEVGSICAIDFTRRLRTDDWPLPWISVTPLRAPHPIEKLELAIRDLDEATTWATTEPGLECARIAGDLVCERAQIEALPPDVDLSLVPDLMPIFTVGESVSWQEVARRAGRLVEDEVSKGVPPGAVDQILSDAGASRQADPETIWNALFEFTADDVRYLGLEHGRNAVVPHPPAQTLERRFGDCKDKVTLLIALARAAGLDAYPVLVATDRFSVDGAPMPSGGYFDHMVVCHRPTGESIRCADPTLSHARASDSEITLGGRLALHLSPESTAPTLMDAPEFASRIRIDTHVRVECDGSVETTVRRSYEGESKIRLRAEYTNVAPEIRRRFLAQEFEQITRTQETPTIRVTDFREKSKPIVVEASFSTPGGGELAETHLQLAFEPWLVHYGQSYRTANVNYPTRVSGLEVESRQTFTTCDESRLRYHGPLLDMETAFGHLHREYLKLPDQLVVETRFAFPSRILQVEEFERVDHFIDNALAQTMIWFELIKR